MTKRKLLLIVLITLLATTVCSQEVILTDFPAGVAGDVDQGLFDSYKSDLQVIADTLTRYPKALAIVTGGADGLRFHRYNDALNPGIALGRAHALRNYLISEMGIDSTQILVQSADYKVSGGQKRYASVRVSMKWLNDDTPTVVAASVGTAAVLPPETTFVRSDLLEHMGLQLGAGLSTSPFGLIPVISGAVTWKRQVYVEAILGYTIWEDEYFFSGTNLNTKNRMSGALISVFPLEDLPVGVVGGWVRIEEISNSYYKYVRLSEGPILGLRATPFENLSVTGVYNPSKERDSGSTLSIYDSDQFMLYATLHVTFGGAK